jgi:hypothetical protein
VFAPFTPLSISYNPASCTAQTGDAQKATAPAKTAAVASSFNLQVLMS